MPYCVHHSMLCGPGMDEGSHDVVARSINGPYVEWANTFWALHIPETCGAEQIYVLDGIELATSE